MLLRAATRTVRPRSSPIPLRANIPYFQTRTYAKPPRPKKPYEYQAPSRYDSSAPNPSPQSGASVSGKRSSPFSITGTTTTNSSSPSSSPDYSKLQDEFTTSSASDNNTAPQSTSPSAIDPAEAQAQQQEPRRPLPDLTQGIPSTLEAELDQADKASRPQPASLNVTEDPARASSAGSRRGGGDLPRSANITSMERRRNRFANYMYAILLSSAVVGTVYLGRNWESEEEEALHPNAPSGWGFGLFYNRASARLADVMDYYNEPAFAKLLPDPDPLWARPYTLVLSLEDLLVHSEWTREHGWRMAKRPGVDYFLRYLSQYYELVIFTSLPSMTGDPIIRKLDPYRVVSWPLFREATRYKNGEYIKDLTYLNRPLSRTLILDTSTKHTSLQPANAIHLPPWTGSPTDKELVSFIPFLEYIAAMELPDVRDCLASFANTHIPTEYSRREAIAREKFHKEFAERKSKKSRSGSGAGGSLLSSFGLSGAAMAGGAGGGGMRMMTPDGVPEESLSEGFAKGKTYMDQVRERGQRQYEFLDREIRENGDKYLQEMAAEEKKLQDEAMKGMQAKFFGGFWGGGGGGDGGEEEGKK